MAKVYVSSTFSDLEGCRQMVSKVLRQMGHEDVAMEYYVAGDERPVSRCLKDVASCDLYVGIFAWRYGWIPEEENPHDYSITEMEYRHAVKTGKPCLVFLLSDEAPWPRKFIDNDASRIERLREELSRSHLTGPHFRSEDDLGRLVAGAIHEWERPEDSGCLPPPRVNHNLPQPNYGEFIGRKKDLKRVMDGLKSRYPLITIVGFAGVGKTSLALETGYICLEKVASPVKEPATFSYVVWKSAEGRPDRKRLLDELLDDVLNTLAVGASSPTIPTKSKRQLRKVKELLSQHKVLIIFDAFEEVNDAKLVSWFEGVPEPSKVLLASRYDKLQKAWPVKLSGLGRGEAIRFIHQVAHAKQMHWVKHEPDDELSSLSEVTAGNPQAILLALGLMKDGRLRLSDVRNHIHRSKSIQQVFEELYSWSWARITEDAKRVLLVIPLFVGESPAGQKPAHRDSGIIKEALYKVSGLGDFEFDKALELLGNYSLLEVDSRECHFNVHSMTREYVKGKLHEDPVFEAEARKRWTNYYLEFIRENIIREPQKPYWNALVSDSMIAIDAEWPNINEVLKWADMNERKDLIFELVMLLVHYMDSRLLNQERIKYVKKAIEAAPRAEDEALLRLDALGWTYIEEDQLEDAYGEIIAGLNIADRLPDSSGDKIDLIALGLAWEARVMGEKNDPKKARGTINRALSMGCSPWIKTRVFMVAGDIELKNNNSRMALSYYERAAEQVAEYGEEGHGYQIESRIGLAYLGIEGGIKEAKERFEALREQDKIAIGKLYGEYGLALVAYKEDEREKARGMMQEIVEELSPLSRSNLLQKLIYQLFCELEAGEASGNGRR